MVAGSELFDEIKTILERFNPNKIQLKPETDLTADLNVDSVVIMDFVMEIEDKYDIDIPLNMMADIRTLGELTKIVQSCLSDKE